MGFFRYDRDSPDLLQNRCSYTFCKVNRRKPVLESLFNKVAKRLKHRCFLVKFTKFLRTPFFTECLW